MANQDAMGYVTLEGVGFRAKPSGAFDSGEYKRMSNVELTTDGVLKNRRNIYSCYGQNVGAAASATANVNRIIGNLGQNAVVASSSVIAFANKGTYNTTGIAASQGPVTTGSFSRIVGAFRYNQKNYFLVLEFTSGTSIGLSIYSGSIPSPDIPSAYDATYSSAMTRTVLFTFTSTAPQFYPFQFRNFLIHKDRLWIATSVGVYASAPGDPTNFVPGVGAGFSIAYPDNTIRYIMAVRDMVYVLCDEQIHGITYNTDPSQDGQSTVMSPDMGAEHGCVHQGVPYCINNVGIFRIDDYHLTKVQDSRLDIGTDYYGNFLYSFQEYLIVNKAVRINYDGLGLSPVYGTNRTNLFPTGISDNVGGSQIITGFTESDNSSVMPVRTNRIVNPNFEASNSNWTQNNSNFQSVRSNNGNGAKFGTWCLETTALGSTNNSGSCSVETTSSSGGWTSGKKVYLSSYVGANVPWVPDFGGGSATTKAQLSLTFLNASGGTISTYFGPTVDLGSFSGGLFKVLAGINTTVPVNTDKIKTKITYSWTGQDVYQNGNPVKFWLDGVLLEQSQRTDNADPGDYFDGSTALNGPTGSVLAWTGTANASTSTQTRTGYSSSVTAATDSRSVGKVLSSGWTTIPSWISGYVQTITTVKTLSVTLTAGLAYKLASWAALSNTSAVTNQGTSSIKLECLNAANAVLSTTVSDISGTLSLDYSEFDVEFTPPATTTQIRMTYTISRNTPDNGLSLWALLISKLQLELSSTYAGYFNGSFTSGGGINYSWSGTAFASNSILGSTTHAYLMSLGYDFTPGANNNALGYNFYAINMDTGFTSVLDFKDRIATTDDNLMAGRVVNCLPNNIPDSSGNQTFYFITNKNVAANSWEAYVYYMSSSEDVVVNDFVIGSDKKIHKYPPRIDVEIDSYDPQVLIGFKTWVPTYKYNFKRFRVCEVLGQFPPAGTQFNVAYDNSDYVNVAMLSDDLSPFSKPRPPLAHRFGLNQKAHSVTMRFKNDDWVTDLTGNYGFFVLQDLRVVYTDTKRSQYGDSGLEASQASV